MTRICNYMKRAVSLFTDMNTESRPNGWPIPNNRPYHQSWLHSYIKDIAYLYNPASQ